MAVKGKGKQIAGKSPASSASSSGKRKNPGADSESSVVRPKKKRSGVSQFVDDAAEDADYVAEEEEDLDLEWEDFEDFDFELPEIGAKEAQSVPKVPGKSNRLPFFVKEEEMDDDELEEAIKERYRGSAFVSFDEDIKECGESELVARATKDHSIWRVKCMIGRERQAAFCLMQKFVDLQKIGKKLLIFSVFALDHIKGFVYIEADKVCNVFEACNGLCILYPSRVELVPRNEAPNLLTIQKKACAISKGTWVRMKNGKYKGDLAEVVSFNDTKKTVTIKLVPRIDLQAISKKFGGGTSLKASVIPAPRLISTHELEDFRPHIEIKRDRETGEIFEFLDGLMLKDGYLYKKVSMSSIIHWGVQPSSAELTKFEVMSKDEVKDVSWLSSIYKAQVKKRLPETSNPKTGDKSNPKDGDNQGNGFDLDELVLFGKKGCGIIVDKENDTFKVLQGDANGSEVVTISIREIKKICIDKIFTATDRLMKTISIDDVVKVSEGSLEGREGIVRHMYKGILFIYDECQSENNGFFCAKSGICDLVKKSRGFCGKSGSNAGPSVVQSPIISFEQEDNSHSSSRNRRSNNQGTYSVGQTLRICKGPLKGYLCRVIRVYRADITVKLDSLGKLLTVDEKLLSIPNSKRDDATTMQCDMFGSQGDQSIGGLVDDGRGFEMNSCELDAGISSFGRDSWNAPSSSSFSFLTDPESKDESKVGDPWGSKVSLLNGDQEQGGANSWVKATSISADANCQNDTDAWNKTSSKGETSADGWQTGQNSSVKGVSDGWASVANAVVEGVNDAGGWSKTVQNPGESQTLGGWEKTNLPSSNTGGSWNTKGATADWNKETSGMGKAEGFGGQSGNWASPKNSGGDNRDSWDMKGKGLLGTNEDSWGKSSASLEKNPDSSKTWKAPSTDENQGTGWDASASSPDHASQTSIWDKVKTAPSPVRWEKSEQAGVANKGGWGKASDGNQTAGWTVSSSNPAAASFEVGGQSKSWDTAKTLPSSSGCWNSKETVTETVGGWKTTSDSNQADGWGASAHSATPSVEHSNQTSSWDSEWQKPNQADAATKESWKKDGCSNKDQSSGWNKAGNSEDGKNVDCWNKTSSGGQGFGQENQREQNAGDSNPKNSDWCQGSGWSQGTSNNENSKNWGQGNSWNQQSDFDGGRGSGRGRGRGRFGGRGGRNEDNSENDSDRGQGSGWSQGTSNNENNKNWGQGNSWNQQGDFDGGRGSGRGRGRGRFGGRGGRNDDNSENAGDSDGGWRSGRGGGRSHGWNGAGGYNRDNSETREFGRGRGRGRGREGKFESSNWRNKQESFDNGGFSNKPSSSWGGTEGSSWSKSKDVHSTGVMDEKVGWNSEKSFGGGVSTPGWGTDPGDAGGNKNDMNIDHASSWSKGMSTGKQIDDWNKDNKNDSWTAKTSDNKDSSWNQISNNAAEGDAKWNISNTTSSEPDGWKKNEIKDASTSNTIEAPGNDNDWTSQKVINQVNDPSSGNKANWGNWNESCSGGTANNSVIPESSKGWGGNNLMKSDLNSSAWESKKETSSSQGNWGGVQTDSSGDQSSGWNNGGNKWNKQGDGQSNAESWNRGSDFGRGGGRGRYNSFSGRGSDFGRGGGRGRDGSFSGRGGGRGRDGSFSGSGSDFGRGGGRGRDNSFSNRGRGRGRNSDGLHGWNRDDGSCNEGNDMGQASWNSLGNSEKGLLGSWKSEGEKQPASWANQGSGWPTSSAPVSKVESGKSSCDSPTVFGSSTVSGWESASAKETLAANTEATHQKKTSDGTDVASGWMNGSGSSNEQKNNPWSSGSCDEQKNSPWGSGNSNEQKNNPWGSGSSNEQKNNPCGSGSSNEQKNNPCGSGSSNEQKNNPWGSGSSNEQKNNPWGSGSSNEQKNNPRGSGNSSEQKNYPWVSGNSSEQKNDPLGSVNASKGNQQSDWNKTGQKNHIAEADDVGAWDKNNSTSGAITSKDTLKGGWDGANSDKPRSSDGKVSAWGAEPSSKNDAIRIGGQSVNSNFGALPKQTDTAGEPDGSLGGDEGNTWGKAAGSWANSGNSGGNAGW